MSVRFCTLFWPATYTRHASCLKTCKWTSVLLVETIENRNNEICLPANNHLVYLCAPVYHFGALIVEGALGRTSCTRSYDNRPYDYLVDSYGSKTINNNNNTLTILGQ
uniref:Putative secreted protein n=1 Tax=Anopheles darlingi TaxID=43151 RepID=A0A2M4DHZ9_ANODA